MEETIQGGSSVFEGYTVIETLGRGGMGEVLLARHESSGMLVAIKRLRDDLTGDRTLLKRFINEIEWASRVESEYVVKVLGTVGTPPAIVYEYVDGKTLRHALDSRKRPPRSAAELRKAVELCAAICRGLEAIHQAGLLHRDMKPENILLSGDGTPRITDLGIAKPMEHGHTLTATGMLLGTPAYMAPELLKGERASTASDVYALGVIMWEVLCGFRPFDAPSVPLLFRKVEQGRMRSPSPSLPGRLKAMLERMCARDPEHRPNLEQVAAGLEAVSGPGASSPTLASASHPTVEGAPTPAAAEKRRRRRAHAERSITKSLSLSGADSEKTGKTKASSSAPVLARRTWIAAALLVVAAAAAASWTLLPGGPTERREDGRTGATGNAGAGTVALSVEHSPRHTRIEARLPASVPMEAAAHASLQWKGRRRGKVVTGSIRPQSASRRGERLLLIFRAAGDEFSSFDDVRLCALVLPGYGKVRLEHERIRLHPGLCEPLFQTSIPDMEVCGRRPRSKPHDDTAIDAVRVLEDGFLAVSCGPGVLMLVTPARPARRRVQLPLESRPLSAEERTPPGTADEGGRVCGALLCPPMAAWLAGSGILDVMTRGKAADLISASPPGRPYRRTHGLCLAAGRDGRLLWLYRRGEELRLCSLPSRALRGNLDRREGEVLAGPVPMESDVQSRAERARAWSAKMKVLLEISRRTFERCASDGDSIHDTRLCALYEAPGLDASACFGVDKKYDLEALDAWYDEASDRLTLVFCNHPRIYDYHYAYSILWTATVEGASGPAPVLRRMLCIRGCSFGDGAVRVGGTVFLCAGGAQPSWESGARGEKRFSCSPPAPIPPFPPSIIAFSADSGEICRVPLEGARWTWWRPHLAGGTIYAVSDRGIHAADVEAARKAVRKAERSVVHEKEHATGADGASGVFLDGVPVRVPVFEGRTASMTTIPWNRMRTPGGPQSPVGRGAAFDPRVHFPSPVPVRLKGRPVLATLWMKRGILPEARERWAVAGLRGAAVLEAMSLQEARRDLLVGPLLLYFDTSTARLEMLRPVFQRNAPPSHRTMAWLEWCPCRTFRGNWFAAHESDQLVIWNPDALEEPLALHVPPKCRGMILDGVRGILYTGNSHGTLYRILIGMEGDEGDGAEGQEE